MSIWLILGIIFVILIIWIMFRKGKGDRGSFVSRLRGCGKRE
jgi:cbb3-type cytochrome oxidase subunit 3